MSKMKKSESNGMILCPGFKRNGKNAGGNQPNAGYRSKPNGNVLKLGGCN